MQVLPLQAIQPSRPLEPITKIPPVQPKPVSPSPSPLSQTDQVRLDNKPSPVPGVEPRIHFIFFSDSHSRSPLMDKFIQKANAQNPDLILDGGDFVHDGTEPEIKKAYAQRAELNAPLKMVTGNHDVHLRGPFSEPPPQIPDFQSFDQNGVHFILLDNEDETLTESQFEKLEADLKANPGKPTVVAMHVPVFLAKERLSVKLGKYLPLNFASPVMTDPQQIARFHQLMKDHGVKAVLAGHTHDGDEVKKDGVAYITAGATGGLTPGLGIGHEYLDFKLEGSELKFERIPLDHPSKNPFAYLGNAVRFYQDLNQFNHQELGWDTSYFPSVNFEFKGGIKQSETSRGQSLAATATAVGERLMDEQGKGVVFVGVSVSGGPREALVQGLGGYKYHVLGNYNKGLYLGGSVGVNGGYLHDKATAGVGAKVAVGGAYKNWTVEIGQEWATNHRAQTMTVGYRF